MQQSGTLWDWGDAMEQLTSLSTDARLVRRALVGESSAFETLVWRYQRKAFAIVHAIGVRESEREDVVQESFLHAYRSLDRLKDPAAFGAWFLTIVRNLSRTRVTRRRERTTDVLEELQAAEPEDIQDIRSELEQALRSLPDVLREAILLYYYEGKSSRQVARALGVSHTAARSRLKRGRDVLRAHLWSALEEAIREKFPETRDWRERAGRLSLFVLATCGVGQAGRTVVASSVLSPVIISGGSFVVMKNVIVGVAVLCVLIAALWSTLSGPDAEPGAIKTHRTATPTITFFITTKLPPLMMT
ncbi:MAG: sigma-70 family RNA polymerase sigma factor, partial [Planctomycetota bacterium]